MHILQGCMVARFPRTCPARGSRAGGLKLKLGQNDIPILLACTCMNTCGRVRALTSRFSSAYPMPDGACVRSVNTHHCPSGDRARSAA